MSYILDALKRAERERKQGQVSVLDEIPAAPAAEPQPRVRRLLVPVASAVVALGALLFALVVWRHHGAPAAPPVAVAPVAMPPAPPQPVPAPPVQPPTATIEDGGKLATLDDVYQAPPPPPAPGTPSADQAGPPPAGAAPPSRRGPAPTMPAEQQALPPDAGAPAQAADAAPADATPQDQAPPPPAPAAEQQQPQQRQLKEMPENFRANFPAFTVDVHAYNSDPRRRFVLIGGKRYREGDTLTEGPRILGIVAEGIVFEWQGQQVLYAISR